MRYPPRVHFMEQLRGYTEGRGLRAVIRELGEFEGVTGVHQGITATYKCSELLYWCVFTKSSVQGEVFCVIRSWREMDPICMERGTVVSLSRKPRWYIGKCIFLRCKI